VPQVISALDIVLTILVLFGFPALAVAAWRKGGRPRLTFWAVFTIALVAGWALVASSARFGNRLAPAMGYWTIAPSALAALGLQLGLPIVAAAVTAGALGKDKLPFWVLYATSVGAASVGWLAGVAILLIAMPL
jgi:hypothetical protein